MVSCSMQDLHHFSGELTEYLIKNSLNVLPILDDTLIRALQTIYKSSPESEKLVH